MAEAIEQAAYQVTIDHGTVIASGDADGSLQGALVSAFSAWVAASKRSPINREASPEVRFTVASGERDPRAPRQLDTNAAMAAAGVLAAGERQPTITAPNKDMKRSGAKSSITKVMLAVQNHGVSL
jgi:hypothetical protein